MPDSSNNQQNQTVTTAPSTPTPVSFPTMPDLTNTPQPASNGSAAPPVSFPDLKVDEPKKKFGGGKGKIIATILGIMLLVGGIGTGAYLALNNQNPQEKAAIIGDVCTPGTTTSCVVNNCPGTKECNAMGSAWLSCQDKPGDNCPASGGGGGGGCFLPGTQIKTSGISKSIEEVKINDLVYSFNDYSINQSKVTNLHKVYRDYYFNLVAGNYSVKVTAEHPFYIGNGQYKEVKDLKSGDLVYVVVNNKLTPVVVTLNIKVNRPTEAYNLTVENDHTFFANNFAVHNKTTGSTMPICSGTGWICTGSNPLSGQGACVAPNGDYCCTLGFQPVVSGGNNVCSVVPSCNITFNTAACSDSVLSGGSRCLLNGNAYKYCCPAGQIINTDLNVCVSAATTSPDPGGPVGCPVSYGSNGNYSLPSACTKVTEPGKAPTCVNNQRCAYTRDEAKCEIGKNPDGTPKYKWCFLHLWTDCKTYQCSPTTTTPPPTKAPTPTPTSSPTSAPVTAQCVNVKAYSSTWTLLTDTQLKALKSGNTVNFCVVGSASAGSFDKAKFTINGTAQAETTTKRPNTQDYCQSYTIPANTYSFDVTAQIHHATLGWK